MGLDERMLPEEYVLRNFMPPKEDLADCEILRGEIKHVDSRNVYLRINSNKDILLPVPKLIFASPNEYLEINAKVNIYFWKTKSGEVGQIAEVVIPEENNQNESIENVVDTLEKSYS
ncbi:hypothetical protein JW851_04135 [Candidatus Woesearchaeota archaeon]|nr:hypothetical protein [Candidatus Woesearchaeota archaeon]